MSGPSDPMDRIEPYPPDPVPYPHGHQPDRRARIRVAVIAGLVCAVVLGLVAVAAGRQLSGRLNHRLDAGGTPPTASPQELLLTESDFPQIHPPGTFSTGPAGALGDDSEVAFDPPECRDVLGLDPDPDSAQAELTNYYAENLFDTRTYNVRVAKGVEPTFSERLARFPDTCRSVVIVTALGLIQAKVFGLQVPETRFPVTAVAAALTSGGVEQVSQVFLAVVRRTAVEVSTLSTGESRDTVDTADPAAIELLGKQVDKVLHAA